jgi:hypothetical protein
VEEAGQLTGSYLRWNFVAHGWSFFFSINRRSDMKELTKENVGNGLWRILSCITSCVHTILPIVRVIRTLINSCCFRDSSARKSNFFYSMTWFATPGNTTAHPTTLVPEPGGQVAGSILCADDLRAGRGRDRGPRPPYEREFSNDFLKIQINFENSTIGTS